MTSIIVNYKVADNIEHYGLFGCVRGRSVGWDNLSDQAHMEDTIQTCPTTMI